MTRRREFTAILACPIVPDALPRHAHMRAVRTRPRDSKQIGV